MHPREYANMALTASAVAESEGFCYTARAFEMLAAATLIEDRADPGFLEMRRLERALELANVEAAGAVHQ